MRQYLFGLVQLPRLAILLLVTLPPVAVGVFAKLNPQHSIAFGPSESDWALLPAVGTVPPPFVGTTLSGQPIDLESYRGHFVLLDFWATWCGPCIAEIPDMKRMYAKYHSQGFEIIGVACNDKDEESRVRKLVDKEAIPWPQIYDAADGVQDLKEAYGLTFYPTMILISPEGRVVSHEARAEELERLLKEAYPAGSESP